MYPRDYFALFPPFPREDTVFVAMSFDRRFAHRWSAVIEPGVRHVRTNGRALEPVRVDARRISNSIVTEILAGIARSRLILADITTLEYMADTPIRNGNVMYEVGIAHALRLPEEVLLFRSDDDHLLFDVSNVRVNKYAPDEKPDEARILVSDSIVEALRELDLRRGLAVAKAVESLDLPCWRLLARVQKGKKIQHPEPKTVGEAITAARDSAAIQHLLELGAIRASYLDLTAATYQAIKSSHDKHFLTYECTEFGEALFLESIRRTKLTSVEVKATFEDGRQTEEE